jgi:hypothetical protein
MHGGGQSRYQDIEAKGSKKNEINQFHTFLNEGIDFRAAISENNFLAWDEAT